MVQIVLDGTGPTKAELVEGAYEFCGLNGFEFERTPEEMTTGLRMLNDLMAEWLGDSIDLGFDFPTYGNGLLEEPSGIPTHAAGVIKKMLAQQLCPALGGTLSPDVKATLTRSYIGLRSRTAARPRAMISPVRMPSSGVRHSQPSLQPSPTSGDPGDLAGIVGG